MNSNNLNISISHLEFSYSSSDDFALQDINISFEPGKLYAVLGPNGSGKSTLIKCLSQKIKKYSGQIKININNDDLDLKNIKANERAKLISCVDQQNHQNSLSVFDTVMLGRNPYITMSPKPTDYQAVSLAIDSLSLNHLSSKCCNELSGGEFQNVAIAQAFAQNTPIMLFDEPTNNLDIKKQHKLFKIINQKIKDKNLIAICILHDINQAIKYADELIFLKMGKIKSITNGSKITAELLEQIYDTQAKIIDEQGERFVII